jgi:ElaB/YqjD/DUF883 family membrane-anchored ribosome-binding protein
MPADHESATAADRAAHIVAAATREAAELRQTLDKALQDAGVDADALAADAREKLTAFEKLAAEELARRPLRTLAIAAGIGAIVGALIAR